MLSLTSDWCLLMKISKTTHHGVRPQARNQNQPKSNDCTTNLYKCITQTELGTWE